MLTTEQNLIANKMRNALRNEAVRLSALDYSAGFDLDNLVRDIGNESLLRLAEILKEAGR